MTGANFGHAPLSVHFVRRGGGPPIEVAPTSASDRFVTAIVPENAGAGPVSLVRFISVPMNGLINFVTYVVATTARPLEVGPEIVSFSVNGATGESFAVPGSMIDIQWDCAGTDAVELAVSSEGRDLLRHGVSTFGSLSYQLDRYAQPTSLQVEIIGRGVCAPRTVRRALPLWVEPPYRLSVEGYEITQAIQYYGSANHLTDPADQAPDNSVPLVPFKPALLRLYLRSGADRIWGTGASGASPVGCN